MKKQFGITSLLILALSLQSRGVSSSPSDSSSASLTSENISGCAYVTPHDTYYVMTIEYQYDIPAHMSLNNESELDKKILKIIDTSKSISLSDDTVYSSENRCTSHVPSGRIDEEYILDEKQYAEIKELLSDFEFEFTVTDQYYNHETVLKKKLEFLD